MRIFVCEDDDDDDDDDDFSLNFNCLKELIYNEYMINNK